MTTQQNKKQNNQATPHSAHSNMSRQHGQQPLQCMLKVQHVPTKDVAWLSTAVHCTLTVPAVTGASQPFACDSYACGFIEQNIPLAHEIPNALQQHDLCYHNGQLQGNSHNISKPHTQQTSECNEHL